MNSKDLSAAFEAILFASGEPVSISKFCEIFELDAEEAQQTMQLLANSLDDRASGVKLIKIEKSYQLCSREEYAPWVYKLMDMRRKTPLSQAAFEVLAVVAYNQPVTKAFVEQVRGVDCSGVVSTLVEKGLLEEKGRLELPGRPLLYGTTDNFLRCFSLSSLDDLPQLPDDEVEENDRQMYLLEDTAIALADNFNSDIKETGFNMAEYNEDSFAEKTEKNHTL